MAEDSFKLFENEQRELNLIKVVDRLVCSGKRGFFVTQNHQTQKARGFLSASFDFAVACDGYLSVAVGNSDLYKKKMAIQLSSSVCSLVDLSMDVRAKSLVLPKTRYGELDRIFEKIANGLNQAVGEEFIRVAHQPYLPIHSDRSDYDGIKAKSMFNFDGRGLWFFQEHRQVA